MTILDDRELTLSEMSQQDCLEYIRKHPGCTSTDINRNFAYEWPEDRQCVYRALYQLEKDGVIYRTDDKPKRCYIAEPVKLPDHPAINTLVDVMPDELKVGDWVVADDVNGASWLTSGKPYQVFYVDGELFRVIDDDGDEIVCLFQECPHLNGGNWRKATPADFAIVSHTQVSTPTISLDAYTKIIQERDDLLSWKADAIQKHPDLSPPSPELIRAREIAAKYNQACHTGYIEGRLDNSDFVRAIYDALTNG